MKPRTVLQIAAIVTLLTWLLVPAVPAGAAHSRAIDPTQLAIGQPALPAGTAVDYSAVSDNTDADGSNNPLKGLHPAHTYTSLGRLTGYREQLHLAIGGSKFGTAYLASIFSTPAQAQAALQDAVSLVSIIGTPLTPTCTAGDLCKAYSGPNGSSTIVYAAFVRGPILIELASSVDTATYPQVSSSLQSALYALLTAVDAQVQGAAGASGAPASPATPTPTATPAPSLPPIVPHNPKLGRYYLAVGDSFSLGYLIPERPADPQCHASDAPGFVCVFLRYLQRLNPRIQLNNVSEAGADSCELAGAGHRCYDQTARPNPLDPAIQFLNAHPADVSPITVTIGGNDLLALLPKAIKDPTGTVALVPSIIVRYRANLDTILSRLRSAAPDAEIVVTTQPNSLGGMGSPPLPAGFPEIGKNAINSLNQVTKDEAPRYGAVIADSAAAFDAHPGGASTLTWFPIYFPQGRYEIHPTPEGYQVYGDTVIKASGYLPTVSAHLTRKQLKPGSMERISGRTAIGASVTTTVWLPHRTPRTLSSTAASSGAFAATFKVGSSRGKGAARVCVSLIAGQSVCTPRLTYTIR